MDGNKDEAIRCVCIAEEAIAAGNKERALKFIKLAQRLNRSLQVDELLAACENLNSRCGSSKSGVDEKRGENKSKDGGAINSGEELNGDRSYTQEHVQLIKQITRNKNYYSVLGVEKTCSVEEIKKAYRKLSLKVHPDKNKAPGSEEAFKKVCKAFKCLSDDGTRRQYDHTGLVEEYEHNQQYNVRQRRRSPVHDMFEDDFDPNEIFRAFFGQGDVFRTSHVCRAGGMHSRTRENFQGGRPNYFILLQILPFLLIFLLAYLPFSEPEYSLHENAIYTILLTTEKHGVEFYVKSSDFDEKYPPGSDARADMENMVIKDHRNMLWRYCHIELQRRQWNRNIPTRYCDKLQTLEVA